MSDSKKPIDRFTCIFHLLLYYLHVLTMSPPPKTPRIFSTTATSPMIFHQHHSKWGNFVDQTCGASSSSYQPADLTSPSQQRPPSPSGSGQKHHPRNGGTTGGWNHRWLSQQSQQQKTRWENQGIFRRLTWEGFCKLLDTNFFWGLLRSIRIWSKFTRFKLQLRFSTWPFRSSPRSMYWSKIDCSPSHVSGWQ